MRSIIHIYSACILALILGTGVTAQPTLAQSPLSSGTWAKFSVEKNAIYKIDYNLLKTAGFNPAQLDPRKLQLYGNGNGMLPQANNASRVNHLQEIAIEVVGESDGVFNTGDYILFYGQDPDYSTYDIDKDIFLYENNLYSDKNFYFLTLSTNNGKRLGSNENVQGIFPVISTYDDFIFHEVEKYNELNSGRQWFGERFDITPELSLSFEVPGIIAASSTRIVSGVMSQSFSSSTFTLILNGTPVLNQTIDPIANTQYGIKGRQVTDTVTTTSSLGTSQIFRYQFQKGASGKSIGYLDFLLAQFQRTLALYGTQTFFLSSKSLNNSVTTFEISSFPPDASIWNVTDPFNSAKQSFQVAQGAATFSTSTSSLQKFVALSGENMPFPSFEEQITNQNLQSISSPVELLMVTHPDLITEVQRLASHRRSFNGLSVLVVSTEEIFNDFSGGKQDPTAIRDLAKSLYDNNGLKNLLLFGRSSFDYKDRVNKNTNLVPTYESRNSLSPLETYSSDDYFSFMEADEGEWQESPAINHTLDIGVGRLPLVSVEEAAIVVDKLIAYDTNPNAFGTWRKEIIFVADDGDFNLHQSDADKLATDIEAFQNGFDTKKIYLDAYKQISKPSGQESPDARKALNKALNKGALIVNFTGHGSERVWLQERILDEELVENWENETVFPLLVTATCEFGRHDDPTQISTSELALTKKGGGAIGLVTAARPVSASTNAFLNKAFYEALFTKENGSYRTLGAVFAETKNNSVTGVSNRNFSLLGDPSMRLAIANREVVVSSIKTTTGSDTLKALSRVVIKGEIQTGGILDTQFNGTLTATLKDKEFTFKTLGDENPVFTYKDRNNTLFRGQASVSNGQFELEFILPKNIAYQVGFGKLSLYAQHEEKLADAIGGAATFKIGESEPNADDDITAPEIKLFMGDTTFVNGGIASANTKMVAQLSDASGINIANYGIGNSLTAILDGEISFEVGEYYLAAKDDFTRGTITFPIEDLQPGKHTIELLAWDVHNNPASAMTNFVVTDGDGIVIEELSNYPNPFSSSTAIKFTHNRAGDDLEIMATIYDIHGQTVDAIQYEVFGSQYLVTLPEWTGTNTSGAKLTDGVYVLRLMVRSLLDGSKNERISRLIMLN